MFIKALSALLLTICANAQLRVFDNGRCVQTGCIMDQCVPRVAYNQAMNNCQPGQQQNPAVRTCFLQGKCKWDRNRCRITDSPDINKCLKRSGLPTFVNRY